MIAGMGSLLQQAASAVVHVDSSQTVESAVVGVDHIRLVAH